MQRSAQRFFIALAVALAALVLTAPASAHNTPWGFTKRDVLQKKGALRYIFKTGFPGVPVELSCQGLDRVRLRNGLPGFHHIYCVVSISPRAWLWHLDSRGREFLTRPRA